MKHKKTASHVATRHRILMSMIATTATVAPLLVGSSLASAETRGYVISWFATATNNPDFSVNCPQAAKDPNRVKFAQVGNNQRDYHALVDGKPVDPFNYPDAVQQDPNLETVVGKYAYGFDLGGNAANKFIDPETHEKVDNQLWRAIGCTTPYQATPPTMPYPEGETWPLSVDAAPAWAIQISGPDLSKDGPVTVTLDRTGRHLERDALGGIRSGVTYVIDPSPRSHNVLSGEIKNGMLRITPAAVFYLEGSLPFYSQIDLKNVHMRIWSAAGGKLVGYWGGYTDWHKWVYIYTSRPASGADSVSMYRALEKLADADPDPVTGKNRLISTTWRMEAVPAYLVTVDGKILATVSTDGLGGRVQPPIVAESSVTGGSSTAGGSAH